MKHVLLLAALLVSATLFAQDAEESTANISLGQKAAYMVEIEGANNKMAEKVLKDFLKNEASTKGKKNKKAKEWFAEQARLSGVNKGTPVDLYIKIEEGKDLVRVYFLADRGDAFISSNDTPDDSPAMSNAVTQYGISLKKYVVNEELKEQEKQLKKFEKDLAKLEKKNDGFHDDIKKAEQKIVEAKENIEKNLVEQENKRAEIQAQIEAVEAVTAKYNAIGKQ